MAAGPGDLTKGRDKDKEAARTAEGAAGFSWAEEVNRVKKIWGAPSANEPLAPGGLSAAINQFGECIKPTDAAVIHLKKLLNLSDLVVAGLKVDVPLCLLREYNAMDDADPRLPLYRSHSVWGFEFVDFGAFLDRFDTLKGVVCFLVYSAWDSACLVMPNVGLQPYPLCWRCPRFGEMKCSSCLVARYCSKACQEEDWRVHKLACTALHGLRDRHVAYRF